MFRKGPSYTRQPRYTRGPRNHHDPTCGTRQQKPSPDGGIRLADSICRLLPHLYALPIAGPPFFLQLGLPNTCSRYGLASSHSDVLGQTIRSRKQPFGRTRTSDTVSQAAIRTYSDKRYGLASSDSDVLGQAIRSDCTKPQKGRDALMDRIARNQRRPRVQQVFMPLVSRIEMNQSRNVAQDLVSLCTCYSMRINLLQYTYL